MRISLQIWPWNAVIVAYMKLGFAEEALTLFFQIQGAGAQPNKFTFFSNLSTCAS